MKAKTKLRFLIVSACFLFVLSIFCPFLEATWQGLTILEGHLRPETFWSFKEHTVTWSFYRGVINQDWWFADYWSGWVGVRAGRGTLEAWNGPVLVFIFEAQVLTVLFAALAILRVKLYMLLSSTILNAFTTFCMWFVSQALSHSYAKTLQAGFWLSLSSVLMLFVAFILSLRWSARTHTPLC